MTARAQFPVAVRVQAASFDPSAEFSAFAPEGEPGALVSFAGWCRSEGGRLSALELEHYPGMVEAELVRLVDEAARRWPLMGVTVIHRHGRIGVGEPIVLVLTASAHRAAAFAAAEFLMDWLKTRAPFWKREIAADGTVGEWIDAKSSDEDAAARWARPRATE